MPAPRRLLTVAVTLVVAVCQTAAAATPTVAAPASEHSVAGQHGPDFNADGYADLAASAPREEITGLYQGAVHVLYGSADGLAAAASQFWHYESPGMTDPEDTFEAQFGTALAWADFDGDGYDDLAIGAPGEQVGGHPRAGAVRVLYGSPAGLTTARDQFWSRLGPDLPAEPDDLDLFGKRLQAGDFDGDDHADLAIGVDRTGTVHVVYGASSGLASEGNQVILTTASGLVSLAAGDVNGDGTDELVVCHHKAAPGADVFYGSPAGIDPGQPQLWSQATPGIRGVPSSQEDFGYSAAVADLNADGFGDVVLTVPNDGVGEQWTEPATTIQVIYGSFDGVTADGDQRRRLSRYQDDTTIDLGLAARLGSGDVDGDSRSDLAIGAGGADLLIDDVEIANAGAAIVLRGGHGLPRRAALFVSQGSPGVKGVAEVGDNFGSAVALADYDGDGHGDLSVGAPYAQDGPARRQGGVVQVFYGVFYGDLGRGSIDRDELWTQDTTGIDDTAEWPDALGAALS